MDIAIAWLLCLSNLIFVGTALVMCSYAIVIHSGVQVPPRWKILRWLGVIGTSSMIGSAAGVVAAWLVLAGCAAPYIKEIKSGLPCGCYGDDNNFFRRAFPFAFFFGCIATVTLIAAPSALLAPPYLHGAQTAGEAALLIAMCLYMQRRKSVSQAEQLHYKPGFAHPSLLRQLGTESSSPFLIYYGLSGCRPCVLAGRDLVSFTKVFKNEFHVFMVIEGYPNGGPRKFNGITIIEVCDLPFDLKFSVTPSLLVGRANGTYSIFEGLPQVRLGLGYALRERESD